MRIVFGQYSPLDLYILSEAQTMGFDVGISKWLCVKPMSGFTDQILRNKLSVHDH